MNKKIIITTTILCLIFLLIYVPNKNNNKLDTIVTYTENTTYQPEINTIELNDEEITLLAQFIKNETNNEDLKAKLAVGIVILNRVYSNAFPNTLSEVIHMPGYFSLPENGLNTIEISENDIQIVNKVVNIFNEQTPIEDEKGNNLISAFYWYAPNYTDAETIKKVENEYPPLGQIGERRFLSEKK